MISTIIIVLCSFLLGIRLGVDAHDLWTDWKHWKAARWISKCVGNNSREVFFERIIQSRLGRRFRIGEPY